MRFLRDASIVIIIAGGAVSGKRQSSRAPAPDLETLQRLDYSIYPRRTEAEAAVLEWGHSAIISALDASVAWFGPQTSQAALLEVETQPILASPINGVRDFDIDSVDNTQRPPIEALDNSDELAGNFVVMTNTGGLTGVEMAIIAKKSGAAGLLVVNVDEDRPDDIYRFPEDDGAENVDIPVVMISLNSANVLTAATVEPDTDRSQIINNGMPERIRLYAGGDRPFFEDVEAMSPTVYLIHNLLNPDECDALIKQAIPCLRSYDRADVLQLSPFPHKYHNVDRAMIWQGMIQTTANKAIEERIEQVTGFPVGHYSDWIVDRLEEGAHWKAGYDTLPTIPVASIVVFLSVDPNGGEMVYPSASNDPIKIRSSKGMAVVHHNTNDRHEIDPAAIRALLPVSSGPLYVASKYIFENPRSNARRIILPVLALPFGGHLPGPVVACHDLLVEKFGVENGGAYFDKLCVFLPFLLLLGLAQLVSDQVQKKMKGAATGSAKKKKE